MRRTYGHLFGNYILSLERCRYPDRYKTVNYIIKRCNLSNKPIDFINYFSINSRINVIKNYNNEPIIPTGLQPLTIYYDEIIKSFLKLLIDTSSTELYFIYKFFNIDSNRSSNINDYQIDNDDEQQSYLTSSSSFNESLYKMYNEIFVDVLECLDTNLKINLKNSYDAIGLLIIYQLLQLNINVLNHRNNKILENKLKNLQNFIFNKFNLIINEFINFINKLIQQSNIYTIISWIPAPFIINSSHLLSSILYISNNLNENNNDKFYTLYTKFINNIENNILQSIKKINNQHKEIQFIIANYTILTNIIHIQHIPKTYVCNIISIHEVVSFHSASTRGYNLVFLLQRAFSIYLPLRFPEISYG